jgi:hypothetical protein
MLTCQVARASQIAFILRQGEEGVGGLMPSEIKRLRQLEEENGKLKKIVADLSLDKEMLQDVAVRCQSTDRPTTTAHVEPGRLI